MNDYAKAIHYIKEDDYDGFKTYAYSYVHAKLDKEKAIRVAIRYIRNHWTAARTILLDATLHSSTEAHVSHILSSRLSSRPMGWSEKGAENIAKLRVLHDNGESISEYVQQWIEGQILVEPKSKSAEKALSAATSTVVLNKKLEPYTTYMPLHAAKLPGSESARNGWLKLYKNSGFEKLM